MLKEIKSLSPDLFGQLSEECPGSLCNLVLTVFQYQGHLADLTFDLYHVVENEVREDYECVLSNQWRGVPQTAKK